MEEKLLEALNKINHRLDKMDGRLDEMSEKMIGIEGRVAQEIRQQILDHMFVFETEYGRKINIAFEEITAKNHIHGFPGQKISCVKSWEVNGHEQCEERDPEGDGEHTGDGGDETKYPALS